jgi:hypothetical protein
MKSAKRLDLPDLQPLTRGPENHADDDAIKSKLRVAARDLGFGGSLGQAAPEAPRAATRSIQLVVPDYLFEELGVKAVQRRVTKRFLILEALAAGGYCVEPDDMEEDGRRRR